MGGLSLVAASEVYSLAAVRRLLILVASLAAEHRPWGTLTSVAAAHKLSRCSSRVLEYQVNKCGTWD